jgi:hypothetical protein
VYHHKWFVSEDEGFAFVQAGLKTTVLPIFPLLSLCTFVKNWENKSTDFT